MARNRRRRVDWTLGKLEIDENVIERAFQVTQINCHENVRITSLGITATHSYVVVKYKADASGLD